MRPALRPGTTVLRRDPHHLQLGTAPGRGYVLRDRPGLVQMLRLLDGVRDVALLAHLVATEVPEFTDDPVAVIAELHGAGLLVDAGAWHERPDDVLRAEARHLSAQGWAADGVAQRLERRRGSYVEIVHDAGTTDIAAGVRELLTRSGVRASAEPVDRPTLVVVMATGVGARSLVDALANEELTHLLVQAQQDGVEVGPLVVPGKTPCVRCADLQRAEWDPHWLALLAQVERPLADSERSAAAVSVLTCHAAAIETVSQLLVVIDSGAAADHSTVVFIGPRATDTETRTVGVHPACGCHVLGAFALTATMDT